MTPLLEKRFAADPAALKAVREAVSETALAAGCGEDCARDVVLAVDEACQNIIRHAYRGDGGEVVLTVLAGDGRLVVRLLDFAQPVDASTVRPRPLDEVRPGGLGTHFIREIMDECSFLPPPEGAGNLLQMTKTIERPAMTMEISERGGIAVVALEGDVDLQHSPKVRKGLLELLGAGRIVVVDMARVSYIDSSGVASLVEAFQTARKGGLAFALAGVSAAALRVLQLARLDRVFAIYPSLDEALAKLGGGKA